MEEDTPLKLLEDKFNLLESQNVLGRWIDLVYESKTPLVLDLEGFDLDFSFLYLPELMNIIRQQFDRPLDFAGHWELLKDLGYRRLSDSESLDVLELAKVWLSAQIHEETDLKQQLDVLGRDPASRIAAIKKVLNDEIKPVLEENAIVFAQLEFINAAANLPDVIELNVRKQDDIIDTLDDAKDRFSDDNIELQKAYDDTIDTIEYLFQYNFTEDIQAYIETLELDLFDDISVSPILPICVINIDEKKTKKGTLISVDDRIFKIYQKNVHLLQKMRANGWFLKAEALTMVLFLYIGDDPSKANELNSKDFAQITYSFRRGRLDFNQFSVSLHEDKIEIIIQRLNDHMKRFSVLKPEIVSIRKEFIIPDIELDKDIFMDMITVDPTLTSLFRFSEQENPWTQKKNLSFNVFLLGDVTVSITPNVNPNEVWIVSENGVKKSLFKGDKILTVKITSESEEEFKIMKYIIRKLIQIYINEYNYLHKLYDNFFGKKRIEPIKKSRFRKIPYDENAAVIKRLSQVDPDLWVKYSRPTAPRPDLQVMPIMKEDVPKYQKMGRDVILWPARITNVTEDMQMTILKDSLGNPIQYFYTASTDEKPHITFVENPHKNKDMFPWFPKCMMERSGIDINEDWTITFPERLLGGPKVSLYKNLQVLPVGSSGIIQGNILTFLDFEDLKLFGVRQSKSSFLHCVLYALGINENDPEDFRAYFSTKRAEEIVVTIRTNLKKFASLCAQENPNITLEKIEKEIVDPNVFLDPSRFHRAVEEMLNVNIFTLIVNDEKDLEIEKPLFQDFYTAFKRKERDGCVVILKIKSPITEEYQCELVYARVDGSLEPVFADFVTRKLENVVNNLARSISVVPHTVIEDKRVTQNFSVQETMSAPKVLDEKFEKALRSQYIDTSGKTRAVELNIGSLTVSLITEPIQPLNLPIAEPRKNHLSDIQKLITTFDAKDVSYTPKDGKLHGMWMTISNIELFAPLEETSWEFNENNVRFDIPYIVSASESKVEKIDRLQKVATVYIQIAKRLYVKANVSPTEFMKMYTIFDQDAEMMIENGMRLIPPQANVTLESLLEHFSKEFPQLFKNNKLIVSSDKVGKNLQLRLKRFQVMRDAEIEKTKTSQFSGTSKKTDDFPLYLENFYVSGTDFSRRSKLQKIFMSMERLEMEIKVIEESTPTLVETIKSRMSIRRAPYFFLHKGNLYLIQNVKDGNPIRAATLVKYWKQNKVNTGFYTPNIATDKNVIVIGTVKTTINNPDALMVLQYPDETFAAVLKIDN